MPDLTELKEFLDAKAEQYNHPDFIETDPIQIVHQFTKKEDIEIIGLLVAIIAWGNRKSIIKSGQHLVEIMGHEPHAYVLDYMNAQRFRFVHRTFNTGDLDFFFRTLHHIYSNKRSLESLFTPHPEYPGVKGRIVNFRNEFLATPHEHRSEKHLSNPLKGASAKRINMYLRWMVRNDKKGVDFGIWKSIPASELMLPLDVHTGNIARKLGLLTRPQNDWTALEEIQATLLQLDPVDPVKYDFALFGLGAFEQF